MHIVEVNRDRFPEWRRLRQSLYGELEPGFHEEEMELIFSSSEAVCFIGVADSGTAMALLELSLRNFVDGCLGGPVGYLEGIYVIPEERHKGYGRMLTEFAANWLRSRGCNQMAADAELANAAAQRFLNGAGFVETYRIVEYKRSLDRL
jgi:aminoglycoside 6'-N-acetyltransferase I